MLLLNEKQALSGMLLSMLEEKHKSHANSLSELMTWFDILLKHLGYRGCENRTWITGW